MQYIAFDSHKRYTFASVEQPKGERLREARIDHERGAIHKFLCQWEPGSPVALEDEAELVKRGYRQYPTRSLRQPREEGP